MTPKQPSYRIRASVCVGLGFLGGGLILGAVQTFLMHDYDPLWGSPATVFFIVIMLSFVVSTAATVGAFLGLLLLPRIARSHAARLCTISTVIGLATFGAALALHKFREWLEDSLNRPSQGEAFAISIAIPLLAAMLFSWASVKTMIAYDYLLVARPTDNCCQACGYDLRGSVGGSQTCPECGKPVSAAP